MQTEVNALQPVTRVWVELACGHHREMEWRGGATEVRILRVERCHPCSVQAALGLGNRFLNAGDPVIPININEPGF